MQTTVSIWFRMFYIVLHFQYFDILLFLDHLFYFIKVGRESASDSASSYVLNFFPNNIEREIDFPSIHFFHNAFNGLHAGAHLFNWIIFMKMSELLFQYINFRVYFINRKLIWHDKFRDFNFKLF